MTHELTDVYRRWFAAARPGEAAAALAGLLGDDFLAVDRDGRLARRDEFLASLPNRPEAAALASLRIATVPGCAIARGRIAAEPALRFTSVWIEDGGGWRCVTHHETEEEAP